MCLYILQEHKLVELGNSIVTFASLTHLIISQKGDDARQFVVTRQSLAKSVVASLQVWPDPYIYFANLPQLIEG